MELALEIIFELIELLHNSSSFTLIQIGSLKTLLDQLALLLDLQLADLVLLLDLSLNVLDLIILVHVLELSLGILAFLRKVDGVSLHDSVLVNSRASLDTFCDAVDSLSFVLHRLEHGLNLIKLFL